MWHDLLLATLLLGAIVVYYGRLAPDLNGYFANKLATPFVRRGRFSHFEATATLRLAFAGLNQALFFFIMMSVVSSNLNGLFILFPTLDLVFFGVLLGMGEAALISFTSSVTTRILAMQRRGKGEARIDIKQWQWVSTGGWMRSFLNALRILPLPLSMTLVVLYVTFEEAVFRGLIIHTLRPLGEIPALAASIAFFVAAQTFSMPNWRSAAFPVLGALIIGTIHGLLFLWVPDLTPLIIAHVITFVLVAF